MPVVVCVVCVVCVVVKKTKPPHVLEDNRDNNNNRKNGRNCGCHEVTYNTDNGITSATENVVIVVFVVF